MIDGLKLTFSGDELRTLLDARIRHHEAAEERWTRDRSRGEEDATDEDPLIPEHICEYEADRHGWRRRVLAFIRDHIQAGETYLLDSAALEFGELLPEMPGLVAQEDYEERSATRFQLERIARTLDGLVSPRTALRRMSLE